jgi:hypothetical protein
MSSITIAEISSLRNLDEADAQVGDDGADLVVVGVVEANVFQLSLPRRGRRRWSQSRRRRCRIWLRNKRRRMNDLLIRSSSGRGLH